VHKRTRPQTQYHQHQQMSTATNSSTSYSNVRLKDSDDTTLLSHGLDSSSPRFDGSLEEGNPAPSNNNSMVRALSFVDGLAVLVGIIIGSGVFSSPGLALDRSGSPGQDMIAWAVAGVLVWMCALCYIELGGKCLLSDMVVFAQWFAERLSCDCSAIEL
jgi:amino acid permease